MGLLDAIFSRIDAAKRAGYDLLTNPSDAIPQYFAQAQENPRNMGLLAREALGRGDYAGLLSNSVQMAAPDVGGVQKLGIVRNAKGTAYDLIDSLTRPGHRYRGMTSAEYDATLGSGKGVASRQDYSLPENGIPEGTSFADDAATAESYVNYGRDDPRLTGRPNYLVEVKAGDNIPLDKRDGYYKAPAEVPLSQVSRVIRFEPEADSIIAHLLGLL